MENKHPKKAGLLCFLLGLVLGNKGMPIAWHIVYWLIIVALVTFGWDGLVGLVIKVN